MAVTVVDVHNRHRFGLLSLAGESSEELGLGLEVIFHRAVKIEMVLSQIRENCDVPVDTACALLRQRVRGDFHHRRFATCIGDLRQQLL